MDCPFCNNSIEDSTNFCPRCGKRLPHIIKEQINQEIKAALKEIREPDSNKNLSTPSQKMGIKSDLEKYDTGNLSYETDDPNKAKYKKILREVFADGAVTAEEVVLLANKVKEYGLDKNEAINLQRDVAKELGFEIEEEDFLSGDILLELNTNKTYVAGEMNNLEFRVRNISGEYLEKLYISNYLMNLNKKEERSLGKIRPNEKEIIYLPFHHTYCGNEVVELFLHYLDLKGNASVYRTKFEVGVYDKKEEKAGNKSITISFTADKIMANDFSNMAEIFEKEKKQKVEKVSSYSESEKQWRRLYIYLDEDETEKRRNELIITNKLKEGEAKFNKGIELFKNAERMDKNAAIDTFKTAFNLLNESKECFKKVREIDSDHTIAFEKVKEIRGMISEIEGKTGILEKESAAPPIKLSSGCLTINSLQKKFYIYSKDRITIGRDSKNDIVLRLIPCQPKEQYSENWQKSCQISGLHAEIINKSGHFYIRDIGSNNTGSANGTFIDGRKIKPLEEYPLKDGIRINIAKVLDLECYFLGEFENKKEKSDILSSCFTVLGEMSDSCFGIDKKGVIDAIKFRRRNNYTDGEKYIIIVREITVGRNHSCGVVIDEEKVSDIHAKIFFRDNEYLLEDLNSRHGTWVNGKQANPGIEVSLGKQSEIIIGDVKMNFEGFA